MVWVIYVAVHTGVPAKPAANVMRLAPGFEPRFSLLALLVATLPRWRGWRSCGGAPRAIAMHCGRAWCCRRPASR